MRPVGRAAGGGGAGTTSRTEDREGNAVQHEGEQPMEQETVEGILRTWMRTYLAREHPDMPRPGAVCPFVKPALDADAIEIRAVATPGPSPQATALATTRAALTAFAGEVVDPAGATAIERPAASGMLRALVLAFPDLVARGAVIDEIHALVKGEAVAAGLMIGQFHDACMEPSARNPLFPVNRAPLPLLVVRAMTVHDILFLHGQERWFRVYAERFGHLFATGRRMDPAFRALYDGANERFSAPAVPLP